MLTWRLGVEGRTLRRDCGRFFQPQPEGFSDSWLVRRNHVVSHYSWPCILVHLSPDPVRAFHGLCPLLPAPCPLNKRVHKNRRPGHIAPVLVCRRLCVHYRLHCLVDPLYPVFSAHRKDHTPHALVAEFPGHFICVGGRFLHPRALGSGGLPADPILDSVRSNRLCHDPGRIPKWPMAGCIS